MRCCTDCAARQRQRRCFDLRTHPSPNRRRRFAINFEPDDLAAVWIVIQPDTGSERPDQMQPATPLTADAFGIGLPAVTFSRKASVAAAPSCTSTRTGGPSRTVTVTAVLA